MPGAKPPVRTNPLAQNRSQPPAAPAEGSRRLRCGGWLAVLLLVVGLVVADLATKSVAQRHLGGRVRRSVVAIPGVLSFTYRENTGGPFSLLADSEWAWVLGPLAAVATLAVVWWLLSSGTRSRLEVVACGAIVGGALGNLVDRFQFQAVRDFIDLTCIRWPVFNLADTFICIGVGLLFWDLFLGPRRAAQPGQA